MALLMGSALIGNVIKKDNISSAPRMQLALGVALFVVLVEMAVSLVIHVSLYNIVIPTLFYCCVQAWCSLMPC